MSASCGLKVVGVIGACGEMFDVKLAGNVAGFCEIQWGETVSTLLVSELKSTLQGGVQSSRSFNWS